MRARRNIELKARIDNPEESAELGRSIGAEDCGVLIQRDTYFKAPNGRLKLREQEGNGAQLIAYERPDLLQARTSNYLLVDVEQPEELRAALSETIGIRVVVEKRRHLLLWKGVRIHLDDVAGLGHFLELEAVAPAESDLSLEKKRVTYLREKFEISESDLIAPSYSDLVASSS